jgi:FAD/FMN-containing dehydrogenase
MRRKHGYSADNLVSADVVTADGRLLHASRDENADLFWALRGGGWDMGVVTSLEYQAHELGPDVWVSLVFYPIEEARDAILRFDQFARNAPPGFNALGVLWTFPETDDFPAERRGTPAFIVVGPYADSVEEGERESKPVSALGTPTVDLSGPMPYVEAQKALFDADYPDGARYYWKSTYLRELNETVVDALLDLTRRRPSLLSSLDLWLLGGAIAGVKADDSPLGHRDAAYLVGVEANWTDPADDDANRAWARAAVDELSRFSTGGAYLNFDDLVDGRSAAEHHGPNFDRLVAIKQKYDPDNLFRSRRLA